MKSYAKGIVLLVILLFLVTFGIKNSQSILLQYYFDISVQMPLFGIVFISIVMGMLIGIGMGFYKRFGLGRTITDLKLENRELKANLAGRGEETTSLSRLKEASSRRSA